MQTSMTPEFVEREYNNRALVPSHPDYFARWERDSAFVRATLQCTSDLAYGPDARHRIDWFPAPSPRGTLVFIHGGYWRSLDKRMFSWLASPWVAAGLSFATVNYRLAPAVRIEEIVDDAVAAVNWLMGPGSPMEGAPSRVVIAGHSAGGHLTAALFATDPARFSFDPACIVGGVPISPVVDFAPLVHFSGNAELRLDAQSVAHLNLHDKRPTLGAPLVVAAGAAESSEFRRQAQLLAQSWSPQVKSLLMLPGADHFSIVDAFAERGQPLFEATLGLF